ncbi:MAG: 3-phosphoshikimate 1-carboxyvinyltransferase [Actinomycetota bacterium]|nr:3-phosphoshikimate 1-carboxyvinyltransferase [Actinomycetota bacterium]
MTTTALGPWPAPVARGPVVASVSVPGSKSATNRALVLAALADGTSTIRKPLRSRDTNLMADAVRVLGAEVVDSGENWTVRGSVVGHATGAVAIDLGNAGTVARFVPPLAALVSGTVAFDGDARMRERPVGPLLDALRTLGVEVDDGGRGAFPLTITGRGAVRGGVVTLDASSSSQLVSGLLLAGACFTGGVTVRHDGPPVPSMPHVRMTVQMLRERGVQVDDTADDVWAVTPGAVGSGDTAIEPDLSSAAPFLAAAAVTAGSVTVADWPAVTTQAGDEFPRLLARMGCTVDTGPQGLRLHGPSRLGGLEADLHDVGELTPVLAAVCAVANGPSRLTGVAHLRRHETDRLAALAREIGNLGGAVRELPDGLEISPRPLHGGQFATYNDHRLAMAAAVLGLVVPGVAVENVETTAKTLPGFPDRWLALLGEATATDGNG